MSGEEYAFQQITFWASRGWTFEIDCVYPDEGNSLICYVACFDAVAGVNVHNGARTYTGAASDVLGATLAAIRGINS